MSLPCCRSSFAASNGVSLPAGHKPQLDGLRALAVGAVLLCHTLPGLPLRFEVGAAAVRLFFVLSGFLITGILLRARAEAAQRNAARGQILIAFYARRFLRIFPLYYGVLCVAALLDLPSVQATFGWHASYLSNYFFFLHHDGTSPPYLNHLWSLSVEEQFYLVWPILVLFLPKRRLVVVMLLCFALAPASRILFASLCPCPHPQHGGEVITLSCLDALGGGALVAVLRESGEAAEALHLRTRRLSLVLGGGLLVAVLLARYFQLDWRYNAACKQLATALLGVWLVDRAAEGFGGAGGWLLGSRPMVYLGSISYGIYLYHAFVPALVDLLESQFDLSLPFPADGGGKRFLAVTALTLPIAALSWHFFEKPLNQLKSRFPYLRREPYLIRTIEIRPEVATQAAA